jgi:cytochrome c553
MRLGFFSLNFGCVAIMVRLTNVKSHSFTARVKVVRIRAAFWAWSVGRARLTTRSGENLMKNVIAAMLVSVSVMASGAAVAGDAAAGKAKSATCAGCHGPAGVSSNPLWPNLAGQKEAYLAKQMKAFRDGGRSDPMMAPMAKPLTDDDIANLAAYFSSL